MCRDSLSMKDFAVAIAIALYTCTTKCISGCFGHAVHGCGYLSYYNLGLEDCTTAARND